jgi:hypothetical protein
MSKGTLAFGVMFLGSLNLSFGQPRRLGLLTDSFGIVTATELDEEEARCSEVSQPFPNESLCFQYWQCLPTREVHISCENLGPSNEYENIGEAKFWIRDRDQVHHYLTRRNFSLDDCEEWMKEWRDVIRGEDVVCLSGLFAGSDKGESGAESQDNIHSYWIIDRMKSYHSEWSYFSREKEGPEQTAESQQTPIDSVHFKKHRVLLSNDDLQLEANDRLNEPALRSSIESADPWKSFNQWLCFDSKDVTVDRIEILYGGKTKYIPQLNVSLFGQFLEIALSGETEYDNDQIEARWFELLSGASTVCAYAAYLQKTSNSSSLWTISRIKTEKGYWIEGNDRSSI